MNQPEHRGPRFDPTRNNVEEIARLEREALELRTRGERIGDTVTRVAGTFTVVALHLVFVIAWALVNMNLVPGWPAFDPFPFGILTLLLSGEGVFLALFILISQNRMTRQADRRAHLGLQVSLLAEQELTLILQLQRRLCQHFGLEAEARREELQQLASQTDVRRLVNELEQQLPNE
jgi:uncharacterized membrane protein